MAYLNGWDGTKFYWLSNSIEWYFVVYHFKLWQQLNDDKACFAIEEI